MEIFGFTIGKKDKKDKGIPSPVPPENGSVAPDVASTYGYVENAFATATQSKSDLNQQIRDRWALYDNAEIKFAVDEVINEMVDFDKKSPIKVSFEDNADNVIPKKLQEKIVKSVYDVFDLFSEELSDILVKWYVQGVIAFFVQLSQDKKSIISLKPVNPADLTYIKPVHKIVKENGVDTFVEEDAYWNYKQGSKVIKLHKDSIVWIDSGLGDKNNVKSYIDFATKPMNDLLTLENSSVIYRLTRAPEKRAFYVDTGSLPPQKAEEFVKSLMNRFKSRVDYDPKTGKISTSNRNVVGATVDYWFPRREGSSSTEIDIISESSNAISNIIDEINYFKHKLYASLFIPRSRVDENPSFSLGHEGSISREEVKFSQLISKLEHNFMKGIYQLVKVDLLIKGYIKESEWNEIKRITNINFINNDFFAESKKLDVLQSKLSILSDMDNYIGKFFSQEYVYKKVLGLSDEEIEQIKQQIEKEPKNEDGY